MLGWYHEPGTLLEMGVADAAAGASELGTVKDIGTAGCEAQGSQVAVRRIDSTQSGCRGRRGQEPGGLERGLEATHILYLL